MCDTFCPFCQGSCFDVNKLIIYICLYHQGLKLEAIQAKLSDGETFKGKLFSHQHFCTGVVNLLPGQPAVITNGRVSVKR